MAYQDKLKPIKSYQSKLVPINKEPEKEPNFLQSLGQEALRIGARGYVTTKGLAGGITGLLGGLSSKISGNKEKEAKALKFSQEQLSGKPVDMDLPLVGTIKNVVPFGYSQKGEELKGKEYAKDVIGAGAEAASYAIGAPALKSATTGLKLSGKGFLGGAKEVVKQYGKEFARIAPIEAGAGALGGGGYEAQQQGSAEDIAKSSAYGAAGAAVLAPLISTGVNIFKGTRTPKVNQVTEQASGGVLSKLRQPAKNKIFNNQYNLLVNTQGKIQKASSKFSKANEAVAKSLEFDPITTLAGNDTKIDTSKLWDSSSGGKAITYYENLNDVLGETLKQSKARANLEDLRKESINNLGKKTDYKGSDYDLKVKDINDEITSFENNLVKQGRTDVMAYAKPDGSFARFDVPIYEIQNVKKGMWEKSKNALNRQNSDVAKSAAFNLGDAAQSIIERSVKDIDVSNINKEIGLMREMMEMARKAHGSTVKSGKLGRWFGRTLGLLVGSKGGAIPAMLGIKVGDALVRIQNSPEIRRNMFEGIIRMLGEKGDDVSRQTITEIEKRFGRKIDEILKLPMFAPKLLEAPKNIPKVDIQAPAGKRTVSDILYGNKNVVDLRSKIKEPKGVAVSDIKGVGDNVLNLKFNQDNMFGVVAGFEPEYDENGNIIGIGFDPQKAAMGIALISGGKSVLSKLSKPKFL